MSCTEQNTSLGREAPPNQLDMLVFSLRVTLVFLAILVLIWIVLILLGVVEVPIYFKYQASFVENIF